MLSMSELVSGPYLAGDSDNNKYITYTALHW